jgi:hypothetical protein
LNILDGFKVSRKPFKVLKFPVEMIKYVNVLKTKPYDDEAEFEFLQGFWFVLQM